MGIFSSESLDGLWEQVGTLHPTSGLSIPWPQGSPNASVREFFRFFSDGSFIFGQFPAGARVSFDDRTEQFVCDGHTGKIAHGRWQLEGNTLTQIIALPEPRVWKVKVSKLDQESFVVDESIPNVANVLQVVYKRVH